MNVFKKKVGLQNGDVFADEDYVYTYRDDIQDREPGWQVRLNDDVGHKAAYGEIRTDIEGKPVNDISGLFRGCKNITRSPLLPETIKYMNKTYADCASLEKPPLIPDGVIEMQRAFEGCVALRTAPAIPQTVRDLTGAFAGCKALERLPAVVDRPAFASNWQRTTNCFAGCGFMQSNGDIFVPEIVQVQDGTYAGRVKIGESDLCFHYQKPASKDQYSYALMLITQDMISTISGQKQLDSQTVAEMLVAYARYDEIYKIVASLTYEISQKEYADRLTSWRARIPQGYTCISIIADGKACLLENAEGQIMVLI